MLCSTDKNMYPYDTGYYVTSNLIKHDKNNDLNVFNGFKAVTLVLILFGHKFIFYSTSPTLYTMNIERVYRIGPDILLTNLVDPFLYMTVFLMYVMIKPQLIKRGTVCLISVSQLENNFGNMTFTRSFYKTFEDNIVVANRILPAYGAMMLLTA
ncbi:hypothetical protein ACI65C_009041 [Semiaphis heraclei]